MPNAHATKTQYEVWVAGRWQHPTNARLWADDTLSCYLDGRFHVLPKGSWRLVTVMQPTKEKER